MKKCNHCETEIRSRLKVFSRGGYEMAHVESYNFCKTCGQESMTPEQKNRSKLNKTQAIKSSEAGVREARGRMLAMG